MAQFMTFGGADSTFEPSAVLQESVFETVYVVFKEGEVFVDPVVPRVTIKKGGVAVEVKTTSTHPTAFPEAYHLTRLGLGSYKFFFYIDATLVKGLYDIIFEGERANYGTLTISGQFEVGYASRIQDLLVRFRHHLEDVDPSVYLLISNTDYAWTDSSLLVHLQDALNDINQTPPPATFSIDAFPYHSMLIEGAMITALRAASVKEKWNTMQYSDELSLVIDRAPFFAQLAQQMETVHRAKVEKWKLWWGFYGSDGGGIAIGMGSMRVPFQISRVLSWLPGLKNVFGV